MTAKKTAYEITAKTIISNLAKRNIEGFYFSDKEQLMNQIFSYLPEQSSISWGGSETLKEIGLLDQLKEKSYHLIDHANAVTDEQKRELIRDTSVCDYFFMSSNAITLDGELLNIDGTGNRISYLMYGPSHVFLFIGMNKVVSDVDSGIARIRNMACPPNAVRLNRKTPCAATGRCGDCLSPDCMCNHMLVTRRCGTKDRIKVFLVGEELGY